MTRSELINSFIKKNNYKMYLEIGTQFGVTYNAIQISSKIGVDPVIEGNVSGGILLEMRSDDFFKANKNKFDIIFIDGFHSYEQSLKDALNGLWCLNENGVIVMHDCNPPLAWQAEPVNSEEEYYSKYCKDGVWSAYSGDVWKTIVHLRSSRNDLNIYTINEDSGLGVIQFGVPEKMLSFTEEQIKNMPFDVFEHDRENLLNLKV